MPALSTRMVCESERRWTLGRLGFAGMSNMISNASSNRPPGSTIKLYQPLDGDTKETAEPSPGWRLTQIFERAFLPLWIRPLGLDPKTIKLYREALAHWERITGDPPLAEITDYTTSKYATELLELPGRKGPTLAIGTVRKHCSRIDKLLGFCGPKLRTKKGRRNLGLLELPPVCDSPHADHQPPAGDFTLEEVMALCDACEFAQESGCILEISPPRFWRTLIIVGFYSGLRISELMGLEYNDLQGAAITVWAKTSKGRKGKRQPLHPDALAAIEAIRTPREKIFPWRGWPKTKRWVHTLFKRIVIKAGIPPHRQFGFHGLRKAHATIIADQEQSSGVAQISLGHAHGSTTTTHYVAGRVQDRILASAINRLPSLIGS